MMATSRVLRENESEFRTYESQKAASTLGLTSHWVSGNPHDEFLKTDAQPHRLTHVTQEMMTPKAPSLKIPDQGDGFAKFSTAQMIAEIASERPKKPHKRYEDLLELFSKQGQRLLPQFQALTFDQAKAAVAHIKKKFDPRMFTIIARDPTGQQKAVSGPAEMFFKGDRPRPSQRGWTYALELVNTAPESAFIGMQDWITTSDGDWPPRPDVTPPKRVQPPPVQQNVPKSHDRKRPEPKLKKDTGGKPLQFGPEPPSKPIEGPKKKHPPPARPVTGREHPGKPPKNAGGKSSDLESFIIVSAIVILPALAFFLTV